MHLTHRLPHVMAFVVFLTMILMVFVVGGISRQPPSATPGALEATPHTSHVRELDSPSVTVEVRAMVPQNVKLSDPAQGTVRATVMAIKGQINQVKVYTHEGQMFLLFLAPESLAGIRVGDQFTLQVAQRLMPES